MESVKRSDLHVVMFPLFAFGHISPFVQLSNKLSSHGVKISFFSSPGIVNRIKSMLKPSPNTQIIPITLPHVEGLPPDIETTADMNPTHAQLFKLALDRTQPQVRTLLLQLKPHLVVFDFTQQWIPKLGNELGIKTVFYSVFLSLMAAYYVVPCRLSETGMSPTLEQIKVPPPGFPRTSITTLKTFEARYYSFVFERFNGEPSLYDSLMSCMQGCSVILAKTCNELEAPYINYLKSQIKRPFLLIGPVPPEPQPDELEEKWAKWLDKFEANSVIYTSFGSETFLNHDQIREVALGLELTGLPFFLVLNFPADVDASTELKRALPEGFLERVEGKGIIHSGWVQQQQILAHKNVGCYLFHSGYSSVVEGIVNDCQLVLLPLKYDQFFNSKLVHQDWKAGVEVNRRDEDGTFVKEDIHKAVETVMLKVDEEPGKSIRVNHKKWKEFLLNKDIHSQLVKDLVKELEAIAGISTAH